MGRIGPDRKSKLLRGGALGFPIGETQSIRLGYLRGDTLTNAGTDSRTFILGWSWRFRSRTRLAGLVRREGGGRRSDPAICGLPGFGAWRVVAS